MPGTYSAPVCGAGLGLHCDMLDKLAHWSPDDINFFEIAPENWIHVGGSFGKKLRSFTEKFPFVCHGLSLSLGAPAALNIDLLKSIKLFLREHQIQYYSEHLSYSGDAGNLYELFPIPFTEEAADYVAARIRQAQDILGQRIAIENVTYYHAPSQDMSECEFINRVLQEADCALLLDVNNLYVNSVNHGYDASAFLHQLQGDRTAYIHIAGHDSSIEDFCVDTHGQPVVDGVWDLLRESYSRLGVRPTLLERDTNVPSVYTLMEELNHIRRIQLPESTT